MQRIKLKINSIKIMKKKNNAFVIIIIIVLLLTIYISIKTSNYKVIHKNYFQYNNKKGLS